MIARHAAQVLALCRPGRVGMMANVGNLLVCGFALVGCGTSGSTPEVVAGDDANTSDGSSPLVDSAVGDGMTVDGRPIDGPPGGPGPGPSAGCLNGMSFAGPAGVQGAPGLGAHGMSYCKYMSDLPPSLSTSAMTTQSSGSVIVIGIGRGDNSKFATPSDSHGNAPYEPVGEMRPYAHPWENSGTALYSFVSAAGGAGFYVTTATRPDDVQDEITMSAVEIVGAKRIQAYAWNQPDERVPITSESVTTTGAATLIAFWWGGGFPGTPQTATPNNGFVVIESNAYETGSFVQSVVAVKNVARAGTYDVTWASTPAQGAQLWLLAVE